MYRIELLWHRRHVFWNRSIFLMRIAIPRGIVVPLRSRWFRWRTTKRLKLSWTSPCCLTRSLIPKYIPPVSGSVTSDQLVVDATTSSNRLELNRNMVDPAESMKIPTTINNAAYFVVDFRPLRRNFFLYLRLNPCGLGVNVGIL